MSKEKLKIENFFTLKDVDIELDKYNIFIGEQASGKSLIIKLLWFFREIFTEYLPHLPDDVEELSKYFYNSFNQIFKLTGVQQGKISYHLTEYQVVVDLKAKRIIFSDTLCELFNKCVTELKESNAYSPTASMETAKINSRNGSLLDAITQIPSSNHARTQSTFIPAGRVILYNVFNNLFNMINTQQINLSRELVKFGAHYQGAYSAYAFTKDVATLDHPIFERLSNEILKGKFVHDNFGGFIDHNLFKTRLSDSSTGQQEFLPVYIILCDFLAYGVEGNLYIEEPEAHLYPSAQKAITELLVYVVNAINGSGLYITTHSPYILTVLNNLILANDVKDKQTLFDKNLLIPFEKVRAYYIADGTARDLRDNENRLIIAENLDKVSEQTALDFDKLLDLKYV